ncbi:TetR/AcrR family transcriptional regulator [Alcaligenes sp. SDU_A2]|uniref:TetR/AcrR family transcriptional regulator n=1 Tax=Alcaligenes sp. SDU_A2 TaxID=3136634 RepID=UPI002BD4DE7B|nr:TetR/AcrR family transcriptional regulator [Alcaligenes sp.]HRL27336.1 TetR/AcrR family transcriptional regulator [Alcaligenes sp.]
MKRSDRTQAAILDAAEQLFALHGHENTSMRQITAQASVNLSAVNYHFGSKDGLTQAVFQRRLNAINRERLEKLAHYRQLAGTGPLKASQVVDAFFGPLIRLAGEGPNRSFIPLPGGDRPAPQDFIQSICWDEQVAIFLPFKQALLESLPSVPEEEIIWRFHFMLGATSYALMGTQSLRRALHLPLNDSQDSDQQLQERLMSFLLGGLRAPLPESSTTPRPLSCT